MVITSYHTPTVGVLDLLSSRGARAVNMIFRRIGRIMTGLSPINALPTKKLKTRGLFSFCG